jgi:hypothetical protein
METEVWPNLSAACAQAGVPLLLVNARMNQRSHRLALRWSGLSRPAYAALRAVWAQSDTDAQRLREVGAPVQGAFQTHWHLVRMLSLDNAFDDAELLAFEQSIERVVGASVHVTPAKYLKMSATLEGGVLLPGDAFKKADGTVMAPTGMGRLRLSVAL